MIINLPCDINKENDMKIIRKPTRLKRKQWIKIIIIAVFILIILLIFLVIISINFFNNLDFVFDRSYLKLSFGKMD